MPRRSLQATLRIPVPLGPPGSPHLAGHFFVSYRSGVILWYLDTRREVRAALQRYRVRAAEREIADEVMAATSYGWDPYVCTGPSCPECAGEWEAEDDEAMETIQAREPMRFTFADLIR